ncbi:MULTISPECIES: hypothetical protein [Thalassotalea]|uniref:hypothetical protein n=1 Tax=Thalassotalea TaxID=1518149 RepID=UPI000941D5AB|nr:MULTISPECIES: hypothetical protein [Thalassotalea]OKY27765.1 hypothetical protein BI291_07565 [Thalassotalea sp. PP2-459]
MKYWFSPEVFNSIAITLSTFRWKLLGWSVFAFVLYFVLQRQITNLTPESLIWLALFILFSALQALVLSAFIFFFQVLPSSKVQDKKWRQFYQKIEWCEAAIFGFILPAPSLLFLYAFFTV